MKAYPEYKDSGIEYLGQIPSEWTIKPLKHIAEIGPSVPKDLNADLDRLVSFIPMENLGTNGELDTSIQKHASEVRQGYSFFAEGDVIFAKVTPCFENGKSAIARNLCNGFGFGTTELYVLRPKMVRTKFLFYLISSYIFRLPGSSHMLGTGGLKRVSTNYVEYFKSPTPSDIEQKAIANFLDRETARIDKLIAEKQNFIKLLKEKRQALISHVVTKGLNPDAKMKDSGIEWIGEVPEHWECVPLKRLINFIEQGWSPECHSNNAREGYWGVLKSGAVNGGVYQETENKELPETLIPRPEIEVKQGDLIMSRASGSRELIGSAAYVYETRPRLILSDKLFRLNCKKDVDPEFLAISLGSYPLRRQIELAIGGAEGLANNLSQANIKKLLLTRPAYDEQKLIVESLKVALDRYQNIISETLQSVDLLKEHRTALISAAVTGKIDVRHSKEEAA